MLVNKCSIPSLCFDQRLHKSLLNSVAITNYKKLWVKTFTDNTIDTELEILQLVKLEVFSSLQTEILRILL